MLITIAVMAFAVSLEPFRIGMTVLMLNRPRPLLQLLAFLCGGFAMGMTVGLAVLFVFRRSFAGSSHVTLPAVQILIGTMALLAAAVIATADATRWRRPRTGMLGAQAQRLLTADSLWVAGVAGLGIALPSVDYLAALAIILASGAAVTAQVGALVLFHVLAFAVIEIPLLAYVFAPRTTRSAMTAVQDWIRSRRRVEVATLLAVVGALLLAAGLTGR
ncbi:GAP family protein [Mycobacterium sp. M1]|uniref:GAP family protein n=1 Tax=Mycolicibacter acidiphilus TaxID=2835306 RepID=A0ABS5RJB0_9MYCO|nr:GAP family protein [Mycolicibacter acidiphilus]MBS9534284.1 GAP family protein [Mycolicibacter acidiphilus]